MHCGLHCAASGTGTLPDPAPAINQARHLSAAAGTQDPTESTFFVTPPGRGRRKEDPGGVISFPAEEPVHKSEQIANSCELCKDEDRVQGWGLAAPQLHVEPSHLAHLASVVKVPGLGACVRHSSPPVGCALRCGSAPQSYRIKEPSSVHPAGSRLALPELCRQPRS